MFFQAPVHLRGSYSLLYFQVHMIAWNNVKQKIYSMLLVRDSIPLVWLYILPYSNYWCMYIYSSLLPWYLSHANINKMQLTELY
jgi:hypothetical protein